MSEIPYDTAELHREANDAFFGSPVAVAAERRYRVYLVYRDGVRRWASNGWWPSVEAALAERDEEVEAHLIDGYDFRLVHIAVCDMDDPERGDIEEDDA